MPLSFPAGVTAQSDSSDSTIEAPAIECIQFRIRQDELKALTGTTGAAVFAQCGVAFNHDKMEMAFLLSSSQLQVIAKMANGQTTLTASGTTSGSNGVLNQSTLVNGTYLRGAVWYSSGVNCGVEIYDDTGTLLTSITGAATNGALDTSSGFGSILAICDWALLSGTGLTNSALIFDYIIVKSAVPAAGNGAGQRGALATMADANVVQGYTFNQASSGTASGANAVNSANGGIKLDVDGGSATWLSAGGTTLTPTGISSTTTIGLITLAGVSVTLTPTGLASTTSIGTISTTGTNNPLVTGGRVLFTAGSGSGDFDVSSAAIQTLTKVGVKMKFDAGALAGLAPNSFMALWMIDDNAAGTGTNCKVRCYALTDGSGNIAIDFGMPGTGGIRSATFLASALPAAGNDVILYVGMDNSVFTQQITLSDSLGNVIVSSTGSQNLGSLPVITGNGFLHVNLANHPTVNPTSPTIQAMNIDGFALYNGLLSGAAQSSTPTAQDTGIVAFFRFDEQTGAITADDLNGPHLNLFNFAWGSGGTWLASNTTKFVVTGITSATAIGSIVAGSNAVLITPTGIRTSSTVTLVQEDDGTVYAVGQGSTSALGTVTVSTFTGPLLTGIPSTTSLGLVLVQITNVVAPPPAGGPPISGITGVAALPPSTLAYIAQMAALFSTANVDATGSVALPDPTVICQRVNADQAGIFAKIAERNRTRWLRIAPVVTSNAGSGRVIDLTQLAAPVQRPLQLNLADGRTVSFVDIEDQNAELAPRAYIFATNLVEVGNDFSVVSGPVQGMFYYVQGPLPLKLNGDLTQSVTIPGDWSDLLILPLAAWIAATDVGRPPEEPQRIMEIYQSRMNAYLQHLDHYAGVGATRFNIPRPLQTSR